MCEPTALAGLRVVELGDFESVQYATRTLAALGAEVIKVESPGGDPVRRRPPFAPTLAGGEASIPFEYLNGGKRSVVIDPVSQADLAKLWDLLERTDVLVSTPEYYSAFGIDRCPRLAGQLRVIAGATGASDPESAPTTSFTRFHAGTAGYLIPGDKDVATRPGWSGPYAFEVMDGTALALAILAELHCGESAEVDFSCQAFGVWMAKLSISRVAIGQVSDVHRFTTAYPYGGTVECSDGYACIFVIEEHQWRGFCAELGRSDWLEDERFADGIRRIAVQEEIDSYLTDWCRARSVDDVLQAGRRGDFPVGRVRDPRSVVGGIPPERRFFSAAATSFGEVPVATLPFGPGFPSVKIGRAPSQGEHDLEVLGASGEPSAWRAAAPIAEPKKQDEPRAPLSGLRVVDLTWAAAGPIATSFLAYLGADVVKVEHRSRPDLMRVANKQYGYGGDLDLDNSSMFQEIGAGKRSIELDLRTPEDFQSLLDLIKVADVVVDNMRPGKMEKLGLGYESLAQMNPNLIACSVSGTGRVAGPASPGYAPIFWAEGGGSWLTGWPHRKPGVVRGPVDMFAGTYACLGIMAALHRRRATGEGARIDCSAIETVAAATGVEALVAAVTGVVVERSGNEMPNVMLNDVFPTFGKDQWIAISVRDRYDLAKVARALRVALDPDDPESARAEIARRTRLFDGGRLEGRLQQLGVPAVVSLSLGAALREARLHSRSTWQTAKHPVLGDQATIGLPWTTNGAPYNLRRAAPRLGADTDAVREEWSGRVVVTT